MYVLLRSRRARGVGVALLCALPLGMMAQQAASLVRTAVTSELAADKADNSLWRYKDEQRQPRDRVAIVVQTAQGSVRRVIARDGKPLDAGAAKAEDARVAGFVHDTSKQAKQKKDGAQDDRNATELLEMLPKAFVWTVESEDAQTLRLHFEPDPHFNPPTLQSRVLSAMSGELVVDKAQQRIATISGRLTHDVVFGYGLMGRLRAGGTFRVERRQVAPGLWQIVETHVHIDGKALLFKSIGQSEDEIETEFTPVPSGTTLEQAVALSNVGR